MGKNKKRKTKPTQRTDQSRATPAPIRAEIKVPGPSGVPSRHVVLHGFANDTRSDQERLKDKSARRFIINARLSKSSDPYSTIDFHVDRNLGSSFVTIPADQVKLKIVAAAGSFVIETNSRHELSNVVFECDARSSDEAQSKFMELASPAIDHLAFIGNTPVHIAQIHCLDVNNQTQRLDCLVPHRAGMLSIGVGNVMNELKPIFALYREAKVANSPFYKFLCLYKILEGVFRHIRPAAYRKARERVITLTSIREVVPDLPQIQETTPELVGRPIQETFDSIFTRDFRNRVAHFLLDDGTILNVSDHETYGQFGRRLALIEACAREVIKNVERQLVEANR